MNENRDEDDRTDEWDSGDIHVECGTLNWAFLVDRVFVSSSAESTVQEESAEVSFDSINTELEDEAIDPAKKLDAFPPFINRVSL